MDRLPRDHHAGVNDWGRDVPPYAIVGGNPAAVLRSRFDPATVERLRTIAWWDWDSAKVTRNVRHICAGDVEALERAAG